MPSLPAVVNRYFLNQTLAYWQKIGSDPTGKPVYGQPVQLNCRWEDRQQEIITADGRRVMSKGYLLLTTYLAPGSLVYLNSTANGALADYQALVPTYPVPPTVLQGGREVLMTKSTPEAVRKPPGFIYETYL